MFNKRVFLQYFKKKKLWRGLQCLFDFFPKEANTPEI